MNKPAVSVIIPVYNTEKYLRRCLESVCNQTLRDLEVICVNDASTDASAAILAEFATHDSRVKVITFDRNRGAAVARNAGIDAATGDYLGFVDSDDFLELDFYEKLYRIAEHDNPDAVKGALKMFDNEQQTSRYEDVYDINDRVKRNKAYFYYAFTTAIYRRDFVLAHSLRFPEGLIHAEDPIFTIKASLFYRALVICDEAIYYYCENSESVTKNLTAQHAQNELDSARMTLDLLESANATTEHRLIVFNFLMDQLLAFYHLATNDLRINEIAAKGIAEALRRCPTSIEEWLVFRMRDSVRAQNERRIRELRRNVIRARGNTKI